MLVKWGPNAGPLSQLKNIESYFSKSHSDNKTERFFVGTEGGLILETILSLSILLLRADLKTYIN